MQEAVLDGKAVAHMVTHIPARTYTQPHKHMPNVKQAQKEYL